MLPVASWSWSNTPPLSVEGGPGLRWLRPIKFDKPRFLPQPLKGSIHLPSGRNRLEVRAVEVPGGLVMNLRRVRLVPANS